ncbi:hypothetical protein GW931_00470 [archaeon]|nr:hypothetical protein [archaeon]
MKNKKGSHVGIVLSFTIFIVALIFTYAIVGPPIKYYSQKEVSVSILHNKIIDEISSEVITLRVNGNSASTCIIFDTPKNDFSNPQVYAVDSSGNEVSSIMDSTNTKVESGGDLIKVYYVDSLFDKGADCDLITCSDLCEAKVPNTFSTDKRVLEKNILEVINQTIENNTAFGERMGVSLSDEYTILFDYMNGTIIGNDVREDIKLDVYSEIFEINYLSVNSEEKVGGLIIRVW